jgi:5'-deoxynucleotidase YfbR-like HD superfamily hydrolase
MNATDRLLNTLEAGEVTRYHAAPSVCPQTDAQHQWGVAIILHYLLDGLPVMSADRWAILLEGLSHDVGELFAGDIPATFKWANPAVGKASEEVEERFRRVETVVPPLALNQNWHRTVIKLADMLEGMHWTFQHEPKRVVWNRWWTTILKLLRSEAAKALPERVYERAIAAVCAFGGCADGVNQIYFQGLEASNGVGLSPDNPMATSCDPDDPFDPSEPTSNYVNQ